MEEATLNGFIDELDKIGAKANVYIFKDPMSYAERAKSRSNIRKGMEQAGKSERLGKGIGTGAGAALGALGGGAAGYFGGGKRALPAILGALAGGAGGGLGGYYGGRELGRMRGTKQLKAQGVHSVRVKDSPELRKVLRPALQRKGFDVVISDKRPKDVKTLESKVLNRVGFPDPSVLKALGLPTLK